MFQLNKLSKITKKRKRIGRGGSRGGTSTKGNKGQIARSGGWKGPFFEGGQMPLSRRLPKRGFNNTRFKKVFEIVNLEQLSNAFNDNDVITKENLIEKGLIKGKSNTLLKVLGKEKLSKKLIISADAFSKNAMEAINKVGGKATLTKES